jgi:hypothetical protein
MCLRNTQRIILYLLLYNMWFLKTTVLHWCLGQQNSKTSFLRLAHQFNQLPNAGYFDWVQNFICNIFIYWHTEWEWMSTKKHFPWKVYIFHWLEIRIDCGDENRLQQCGWVGRWICAVENEAIPLVVLKQWVNHICCCRQVSEIHFKE